MQTALLEIVDALTVYADARQARAPGAVIRRAPSLASDRRAHVRLQPGDLERPLRARLKHGPLLTLVDLSAGGVLIETQARLTPGSRVVLEFMAPDAPRARGVTSRVTRAEVASLDGGIRYRGGCAFTTPVSIRELSIGWTEPPEITRKRLQAETLAHLLKLSRRDDPAICRLVDGVIELARDGRPPRTLMAWMEQKLRQHVPLLAVSVGAIAGPPEGEALSFDLGAGSVQAERDRVIFRPAGRLDDRQVRLLEAGASVLGVLHAWYRQTPRVFF